MKQRDINIINYMRHHPDARNPHIAEVFGVKSSHVSKLRTQSGQTSYKRQIAKERRVTARELDDMVLKAVYGKCMVDKVLNG